MAKKSSVAGADSDRRGAPGKRQAQTDSVQNKLAPSATLERSEPHASGDCSSIGYPMGGVVDE